MAVGRPAGRRRHHLRRHRPCPGLTGPRPRGRRPPAVPHPPRSARRAARPGRTRRRDPRLCPGRRHLRRSLPAGVGLAGRHRHLHRRPAGPADLAGIRHPPAAPRPDRALRSARPTGLAAAPHRTGHRRARPPRRTQGRRTHPPYRHHARVGHAHRPRPPRRRRHRHHDPDPGRRSTGRREIHRRGARRGGPARLRLRARRRTDRAGPGLLADRPGLHTLRHLGRRAYKDASARRTIGILWDVGTFWPRAAHPFAPPCYAERAVPDLTWRMATWTRATGGRLVISGHSQGSVLAAAAAWQLKPSDRKRVALLTYGSPIERLYGRWFPAHFGPAALASLHHDVDCWRNLYRLTDPIGGPVRLPGDCGPEVDRPPLKDPLAYGRTAQHPCPHRSSATRTTRPTRPSPRSGNGCWAACERTCRLHARWQALRRARADPRRRAASGRPCSARRTGRPGSRAAPPWPRRSGGRFGRCRTPGPWGAL